MSGNAITGTVYLLHFDRPYEHARHYCGKPASSALLKVPSALTAGEFAELEPLTAMAAVWLLRQAFAHQGAHRLVTRYGAVGGIDVPRLGLAAVGDVAEPLIERPGAGIVLLHAQFGPAKTSGKDPLLSGVDEERADPARPQRRVDAERASHPTRAALSAAL